MPARKQTKKSGNPGLLRLPLYFSDQEELELVKAAAAAAHQKASAWIVNLAVKAARREIAESRRLNSIA